MVVTVGQVLLIEDDSAITTVVRVALKAAGMVIDAVATIAARDTALADRAYDVIITDVMLPDGNGLDTLAGVLDALPVRPPVIVLSAQNTLDTAVRAAQEGAFEYLPKPFDLDELVDVVRAAMRRGDGGTPPPSDDWPDADGATLNIVGRAPAMQQVYRTLARVSATDLTVLILGESGTGKELVAQAIHDSSSRSPHAFVAVNMAAIPGDLIESELFGHEKGAFTGAHTRASGRFEQARAGTLFLDEIGDMPLAAQTRLLRVLQSGDYSPVGSARSVRADVRIVAATNQDLPALVREGRFREDLYYRINVIPIDLPPLRQRASDIALLARHFLLECEAMGLPRKTLAEPAIGRLTQHDWPGNVRELGNMMQRLVLLSRGSIIERADVDRLLLADRVVAPADGSAAVMPIEQAITDWLTTAQASQAAADGLLHDQLVGMVERQLIEAVLGMTNGNQLRAAAMLGINRNTLRLKRQTPVTSAN